MNNSNKTLGDGENVGASLPRPRQRIFPVALAIGGLLSSPVQAESPQVYWSPNASIADPIVLSGTSGLETGSEGRSNLFVHWNSPNETVTGTSRTIITIPSAEAEDDNGGMLTITWFRCIEGESDIFTHRIWMWDIHEKPQEPGGYVIPENLLELFGTISTRSGTKNNKVNERFAVQFCVSREGWEFYIDSKLNTTGSGTRAILSGDAKGTTPMSIYYTSFPTRARPHISDSNGNGILDNWEERYFGNANPGANLPGDDQDGDGMSNFMEFALDTNPLIPNPSPIQYGFVVIGDEKYFSMTYPKNPLLHNIDYSVDFARTPDMHPSLWTDFVWYNLAAEKVRACVPAEKTTGFMRLVIRGNP